MKSVSVLLAIALLCMPASLGMIVFLDGDPHHVEATVLGEGEYESIMVDVTGYELFDAGYSIGDLIKVSFGDISFTATFVVEYNGVGVMGAFVSTPTSKDTDSIMIGFFNVDAWKATDVKVGDKLSLDYSGRDPNYSKIPRYIAGDDSIYDDDIPPELYCNFRELKGAGLKEGEFYRSASPWRAGLDRTVMTNDIYEEVGIEYIVAIGDYPENVEKCRDEYGDSFYSVELSDSGKAFVEHLFPDINIKPSEVRVAMNAIIDSEGKTAISCYLGKDRTGMVCAMMLALTGSSYEEVKADYMVSYVNHYGVIPGSEEYKTLGNMMFDRYFYLLAHPGIEDQAENFDWSVIDDYEFDLKAISETFLTEQAGMTEEEMQLLMERISSDYP